VAARICKLVSVQLASAVLGLGMTAVHAQPGEPLVFAAASLKTALDLIAIEWRKETGNAAKVSYAASPALARQIEQGAPADIFISADLEWMDYLAERKLVRPDMRHSLLANRLVLIAAADSPISLKLAPDAKLAEALGECRLALGEVRSVPAGKYAKQALDKLGLWSSVSAKLAQVENVRAALALVARGEAAMGIVYATDAKAEPRVKILDIFPPDTHAPIVFPAALTAQSTSPAAAALFAYLRSPAAARIFQNEGFTVLRSGGPDQ
jgi:molybdate transport system substrate-binding protein